MAEHDDPLFDDSLQEPAPGSADFNDPRFFDETGYDELPPGPSPLDDFASLFSDMQKEVLLEMNKERAITWIQENQTVAILGAFAVGVFMGVMIRN